MELRQANPGDLDGPVINGLELRALPAVEITDMDEGRRQAQVRFPHETVDTYKTVFGNAAFTEGFDKRLPLMCWQHRLDEPIGRALSAQSLPTHNEVVGQFSDFDAVPLAKRAFSQLHDGTITDWSFGFKGAKYEPAPEYGKGVRRIKSAFMAEFSPVSIGSIPGAKTESLRAEDDEPDGPDTWTFEQILERRASGLLLPEEAGRLIAVRFPQYTQHITITTPEVRVDDEGLEAASMLEAELARRSMPSDGHPPMPVDTSNQQADSDYGQAGLPWQKAENGTWTATGPNGEGLMATPHPAGHILWTVDDGQGNVTDAGSSDDILAAQGAAEAALGGRSDTDVQTLYITADTVRACLEESYPQIALVLRDATLTLTPRDDGDTIPTGTDSGSDDTSIAGALAAAVDGALDSATGWFAKADIGSLPDEVQQGLALVQAAAVSADALLDAMGISDPDEDDDDGSGLTWDDGLLNVRDATSWSTAAWNPKKGDYTDAQWKSACLLDGKLPIAEPDGTINKNAVQSAAAMISHVKGASPDDLATAAKKLMSLLGQAKLDVPPGVLKLANPATRSEPEPPAVEMPTDEEIRAAQAKLDRRVPAGRR